MAISSESVVVIEFEEVSFSVFTLRQILFKKSMLLTVADRKFQSNVDPNAFGNSVLMPVMYQQMFQV